MKVPSHIVGLYNRSVRRYRKLTAKLKRETNPGGYTYQTLQNKLRKLRRKIATLRLQLKIATATGTVALALTLTPASAQTTQHGPFILKPRHLNPLSEPFKFDGTVYPAVVDLDKDGDYDLLVGHEGNFYAGYNAPPSIEPMRYLLNIGTNTNPIYEEKTGEDNPFNDLEILNRYRGPVFADIDKDGDQDLFVGLRASFRNYSGDLILYFRNDEGVFKEQTGPWNSTTKTGNPFAGFTSPDGLKLTFFDLDKDGDLDAIIGGTVIDDVDGSARFISYYKNDGQGNFADATDEITLSPTLTYSNVNPALADVDKDGDADLVIGGYYLDDRRMFYYKQVSPGNFVQQTGPFDPASQSGNPFESLEESETQPVFVDIDNDSDIDLLVGDGDGDHYYRYANNVIHFLKNIGNSVFEEQLDLKNPFRGLEVRQDAYPVLMDLDGDGDLDAVVGNKYKEYFLDYNYPWHYKFEGGKFVLQQLDESPFGTIQVAGVIMPSVADIDGDGDLDVITDQLYGNIRLFRNKDGNYEEDVTNNPFDGLDVNIGRSFSTELADVDGDGDLDFIMGANGGIYYFENTGTATVPKFTERTGTANPFAVVGSGNFFTGHLELADVDHDGDLDLLASEYFYFKYDVNYIALYENTGTAKAPSYQISDQQPFLPDQTNPFVPISPRAVQPHLADQDQDGDLDLFIGDYFGHIKYMRNENAAVVTTLAPGTVSYNADEDEDITVDPTLTLADEDDDLIVQATVTISNFEQNDELHFVSQGNISGNYNSSNGVLTLRGKATLDEYQTVLRTITYHRHAPSGGRTRPPKNAVVAKPLHYRVYDTDFTNPVVATRNLNVIFNSPPILDNKTETTQLGFNVTIDLSSLMSDPDGNLDLTTLRIVEQPASGAAATIDASLNLLINYDGLKFAGADHLTIEVCDDLGECAQNLITVQVETSGQVEVFNAVAPNSSGNNLYMRIHNLPENNKVSIFSRWGDKVFELDNYDSSIPGRRFEGLNNNGRPLPSGTYFYEIEIKDAPGYSGPRLINGYITVKQ